MKPHSTSPIAISDVRLDSRRLRRKAFSSVLACLSSIRDAESSYLDRIPENLHNSDQYDETELLVASLDEAIDILSELY